jgi:ribosomal protein S18 acetylase RimI-like enzyme
MKIRPATIEDASFVAWTVLVAVGIDHPNDKMMQSVTALCRRPGVLYSWQNSMLAEQDGKVVACLISYDGADYATMRKETFRLIAEEVGRDFRQMESETEAGEYYVDSIAVLPDYRGQGIGTQLLRAGAEKARQLHIGKVSIVVSPDNPKAQQLYESLGFQYVKDMFLFNEDYRKMIKEL